MVLAGKFVAHSKTGRVDAIITAHKERVSRDSGFAYLEGESRLFEKLRNEDSVSLNFNKRQRDWNSQDAERRKLRNAYRRSLGLAPLSKADEDNEELTEKHKEEEKDKK